MLLVMKQVLFYPQLPQHDFRMQKVNEVTAALNAEVVHYRAVAKNISGQKKSLTGAQRLDHNFNRCFERQLASALSVLGFLPLFHSAALVEYSLLLLLADNRQQKA